MDLDPFRAICPLFFQSVNNTRLRTCRRRIFEESRETGLSLLEDMRRNAQNRQQSFDILEFLLESEDDLKDERVFYESGAMASSVLEEKEPSSQVPKQLRRSIAPKRICFAFAYLRVGDLQRDSIACKPKEQGRFGRTAHR